MKALLIIGAFVALYVLLWLITTPINFIKLLTGPPEGDQK